MFQNPKPLPQNGGAFFCPKFQTNIPNQTKYIEDSEPPNPNTDRERLVPNSQLEQNKRSNIQNPTREDY
jgi:hypothetical protein